MHRIKRVLQSKWSVALLVGVLSTTPLSFAQASIFGDFVTLSKDAILYVISWILYYLLIGVMGVLATIATELLVYTAQLNNFTDLPVIIEIWQVSRDLTNMFFIVMLLVMAFGTLFRIEAYSWKKLLPKMILAAILVNYSRAICGFIVDASQVVMLTFVAAIKDAAAVGLTSAFQLDKLLDFGKQDSGLRPPEELAISTTPETRLVAIIAAGFMLSTMFTVQCVYIVVLAGRLVMIWFLTVLSPERAAASVLPQTERYASQYDEAFIRYVTVGILAIASLWFSMYVAAKAIDSGGLGNIAASEEVRQARIDNADDAGAGALDTTLLSGFVIATMMLMLGMKLTQENSSELGSYTGKAAAFFTGMGVAKLASYPLGYVNDVQFSKTGLDLNLSRMKDRWAHGFDANKKSRVMEGESVASQKYRQGYILAGALGAGDQVAELGLKSEQFRGGILGNIPILRGWGTARRAPWIFGGRQGKFERAMQEEDKVKQEIAEKDKAMDKRKEDLGYMTVDEYGTQLNSHQQAVNRYGDVPTDGQFDLTNENHRAMLQDYQQQLAKLTKDTSLSAEQRVAASAMARQLANAISKKTGKVNLSDAKYTAFGAKGNYNSVMTDRRAEAQKKLDDFLAKRDAVTGGGSFTDQGAIRAALSADSAYNALEEEKEAAKEKLKNISKEREHLGSLMGSGGELKLRKLINDAAGAITSEDTTELCDGFKDAMHKRGGFGPEALAYFDRLAATNNVNDLLSDPSIIEELQAIDPSINADNSYSMNGMKALSQLMIKKFGLPEQAVMSTMHRAFQHMKRSGNTFMSEMTEVKNGEYVWRTPEEWKHVALIESRKRNASQQLSNATRLQLGDGKKYYKDQEFTLKNLGTLIAPALKTDKTILLNPDIIRHLETSCDRYLVVRNSLLETVKDPEKKREALNALNQAIRAGGIDLSPQCDSMDQIAMGSKVFDQKE